MRNILFIMADQLRWDYLSCYGHQRLETPNIDWLARHGVRFTRAYTQSPICGPARMSFYTGRYVHAHGATANDVPLKVGEWTLGDYLRDAGMRTVLVGKTHMRADLEGLRRLGLDPAHGPGRLAAEAGFEVFERDDGVHPDGPKARDLAYNRYLRERGYGGDNPWHSAANSADADGFDEAVGEGETASGWLLRHAAKPARVREEDSETAYMTRRAMACIEGLGAGPWCVHLSYIKPHWPYIAPAPYHDAYGPQDALPPVRSLAERDNPHPILRELRRRRVSRAFSRNDVRDRVVPVYMGLVKQIDDHVGALLQYLRSRDLLKSTMIVFTSDHGDYLGDHWLGEKDFFHDVAVKIPLIVYDPRPEADVARGAAFDGVVEAIDLVPTFVEFAGGRLQPHRMDGRSLRPALDGGADPDPERVAVSEYDYALRAMRQRLAVPPSRSHLIMAADRRYKYILAEGFRPLLFDLEADPNEFVDLGESPAHAEVRARLHEALFAWSRRQRQRTTESDESLQRRAGSQIRRGVYVGFWDEAELALARAEHDAMAPPT